MKVSRFDVKKTIQIATYLLLTYRRKTNHRQTSAPDALCTLTLKDLGFEKKH